MQYTYTETDAHGALDAISDKNVEIWRPKQGAWIQLSRVDDIWNLTEPENKFRIRHENTVSALDEAIGAMTYLFGNLETPAVDEAFSNFADALKAEILEEIRQEQKP